MQEWEVRLDQIINSGVIGAYQYCKVDQIVLFNKDANVAWNYFTHVHFSSKYDTVAESVLLAHLLHYEMVGSSLFRSIRCGKKDLRIVFALPYLLVFGSIQIQK